MAQFIDRRPRGKNKSAVNRQRLLKRYKNQLRRAVAEAVSSRSIKELERGEEITIPAKDLAEPVLEHGPGGGRSIVHPGNREFVTGDKIDRPPGGAGGMGGNASDSGEGLDEFIFELSREEFLYFFFEDLALPDLIKKQLKAQPEYKKVRAGYISDGSPSNLHVVRSMRAALGRRLAMSASARERLSEAEEELAALVAQGQGDSPVAAALKEEIRRLQDRIASVPFIDTFDLRYSHRVTQPQPTTSAVMFCLMDVSGSMDEERKDIAKRFFMLLYLFLTRAYKRIDLIFIRHHTVAKEVDEEDFFTSRESGGTVVSSALELMLDIIQARYPTALWNIYAAQASDGDNFESDSPRCRDLLLGAILPLVQYFAYVEIKSGQPQNLWREYLQVKAAWPCFAMERIDGPEEIYPVFRELFRSKA